ncbi:hypothetical protein ACI79C_05150 [Geodermatophilus sp. SYSU D00697]
MTAVEVRPVVPEMGGVKVVPDPRPRIERCRLVVDRSAGTATWLSDGGKQERRDLRIGDGPGELAGLVRAVYPPMMPNAWETVLAGRVLLVDAGGRVLARSGMLTQVLFDQAWPMGLLKSTGLPVREERFRNTRLAQKAHPGAAPLWPLTAGFYWFLLTVATIVALLFGAVAAVVAVTG